MSFQHPFWNLQQQSNPRSAEPIVCEHDYSVLVLQPFSLHLKQFSSLEPLNVPSQATVVDEHVFHIDTEIMSGMQFEN